MTILEEEIAALEGVLGAQVETIDGAPVSVRLDLVEGVDPAEVAGLVQAVLRRHGLRSRLSGSGVGVDDELPDATVDPVDIDEADAVIGNADGGEGHVPEEPPTADDDPDDEGDRVDEVDEGDRVDQDQTPADVGGLGPPRGKGVATGARGVGSEPRVSAGAIDAVTVRQTRSGVEVTVELGGRAVVERCTAHPTEVHRVVVTAVADLLGLVAPRVVEVVVQANKSAATSTG